MPTPAGSSRRRKGRSLIGRLVAVLLPVPFLLAGLWFGWWMWSDRLASDRVTGLVVSVETSHSDDSVSYTPTFLYSAPWGSGEAVTYYGSSFYDYDVGAMVPIFVNPAQPDRARVDSDIEFIWLPGGVIAFSLVMLIGGIIATRGMGRETVRSASPRRPTRYRIPKTRGARKKAPPPPAPEIAEPSADIARASPAAADRTKAVDRRRSSHQLPKRDGPTVRRL